MAAAEVTAEALRERGVQLLRLLFSEPLGGVREVDVPGDALERALQGRLRVDPTRFAGAGAGEEPDVLLIPDPSTLHVPEERGEAAVLCDLRRIDGEPYEGDPRTVLRRALGEAAALGYGVEVGARIDFFLLQPGAPEPTPLRDPDTGDAVRRAVAARLAEIGVGVRAARRGVEPGEQRVALEQADALRTADGLALLPPLVRRVARAHGCEASFMPRPPFTTRGCGLSLPLRLLSDDGNAFWDPEARDGLSAVLRGFVAGVLEHARGFCAVTNPTVNSYKRLAGGGDAPVFVTWSLQSRSAVVRIPAGRAEETVCELQCPDASASPYLAVAVLLGAGLAGVREERQPTEPVDKSLPLLSPRERQRLRISELPAQLGDALDALERDRLVRATLGEHVFGQLLETRRAEWREYLGMVHPWEVGRYG